MNILILNWRDIKNPKSGGAEIITHEHAKYWIKKNNNVTWFTSAFSGGKRNEQIDGVKILRRGGVATVYFYAFLFYLKNRTNIDIIVDEIHGIPFFTPLYAKKPIIAFIHEVATEIWDYMYPFPLNLLGKLIEPIYFRIYQNIPFWAPSSSTVEDLKTFGIPEKNCYNIPCPILSRPLNKPTHKEKNPTFIFVSRLVKMKGVEDVIDAFKIIQKHKPNATLWVVGTGEENYVNKLKRFSGVNNIYFFGKVTEKKKLELMRRAHLLLHASVKEGWGLVVVEAAAQATPSVTYNVAGLKDSVKNNITGLLTKQNTPNSLALTALSLMSDKKKYEKFQQNCLNWAGSLKWSDVHKASLKLINSVYKVYYEGKN